MNTKHLYHEAHRSRVLLICCFTRFGTNTVQCASVIFTTIYGNRLVLAFAYLRETALNYALFQVDWRTEFADSGLVGDSQWPQFSPAGSSVSCWSSPTGTETSSYPMAA
jgi:hypothetical protein